MQDLFIARQSTIQQTICEIESKVSITVDIWSSKQLTSYLGLSLHYISREKCIREKCLIDVITLNDKHSGETLASLLYASLLKLGLGFGIGDVAW